MVNSLLNNLVSYYAMDEASGNLIDSAGSADLTTTTNLTYSSTNSPQGTSSILFNGSSSLAQLDASPISAVGFTVSLWFRGTSGYDASTGRCMMSISDKSASGMQSGLLTSNNSAGAGDDNQTLARDISDFNGNANNNSNTVVDTWYHCVGTWNSATSRYCWVNNVQGAENTHSVALSGYDRITIGRLGDSTPNWHWLGQIAHVAVWDTVLTDTQIGQLYNSGSGLVYADFDNGSVGGTNLQLNIGDAWKTVDGMQINIGDVWKTVAGVQINIGDVWNTVF